MSPPATIGVTPDSNGIVQEGDCFVLRFNADASSASTPTSITDSVCQNNVYPNGMTPGAEVGNLVRVIRGVSRGFPPCSCVHALATGRRFSRFSCFVSVSLLIWVVSIAAASACDVMAGHRALCSVSLQKTPKCRRFWHDQSSRRLTKYQLHTLTLVIQVPPVTVFTRSPCSLTGQVPLVGEIARPSANQSFSSQPLRKAGLR